MSNFNNEYFIGQSGKLYTFNEISNIIARRAPHTKGKDANTQLKAVNLFNEFEKGEHLFVKPQSFY